MATTQTTKASGRKKASPKIAAGSRKTASIKKNVKKVSALKSSLKKARRGPGRPRKADMI